MKLCLQLTGVGNFSVVVVGNRKSFIIYSRVLMTCITPVTGLYTFVLI